MRMLSILLLLATMLLGVPVCLSTSGRIERSITDEEIIMAAELVLAELKRLSQTRVYDTLSLHSIGSAASQVGIILLCL